MSGMRELEDWVHQRKLDQWQSSYCPHFQSTVINQFVLNTGPVFIFLISKLTPRLHLSHLPRFPIAKLENVGQSSANRSTQGLVYEPPDIVKITTNRSGVILSAATT